MTRNGIFFSKLESLNDTEGFQKFRWSLKSHKKHMRLVIVISVSLLCQFQGDGSKPPQKTRIEGAEPLKSQVINLRETSMSHSLQEVTEWFSTLGTLSYYYF